MAARGKLVERNWKHNDDSPATIDDISVFVIPIQAYKTEYAEWRAGRRNAATSSSTSSHVVNGVKTTQKHLEETGKQIGNLISDDDTEMEVDPAEEVTVSEVNLSIKDDDDDDEDDIEDDDDDNETDEVEPEK